MEKTTSAEVKRGAARLGRELPGAMGAFTQLHQQATADGALGSATKELIAMSVGIAQGCSGCIAYHGERALEAGASRAEFLDAVGVAILMAGGPGTVYASEALDVLDGAEAT